MPFESIDHAITPGSLYGIKEEPTYSGVLSFMRRKYTKDLSRADVAVSGVPLDLMVTNRPGTRFGPAAIRKASAHLAWSPPWPWPFDPFERLAVIDYGDCLFDPGKPETITDSICGHARRIVKAGVFMLTLGGDHYVTYPLLKAHAEKFGQLSLVHFDAHSDTWAEEEKRLDHGTMFFHALREGLIDPETSVQIGIRTTNPSTHGVKIIHAPEVMNTGAKATADAVRKTVGNRPVYLTFDIDCLDPAYAPGTGTPVPGGLTSLMALEIIRDLTGLNYAGMDVVEVSPAYDVSDITALAGATIAAELLCVLAADRKPVDQQI
ncbi:MAG: agmatinase [Deltaproteobacteria bacterium]|jgi:agmatinase|nr:agmatinase [Deltaproteobacteria bacterium]